MIEEYRMPFEKNIRCLPLAKASNISRKASKVFLVIPDVLDHGLYISILPTYSEVQLIHTTLNIRALLNSMLNYVVSVAIFNCSKT